MSHIIDPIKDEFAEEEFILANSYFYDQYIQHRVHGYSPRAAFCKSFGAQHLPDSLHDTLVRLDQMESTEYYKTNFAAALANTPVDQLWNDKVSLHELLQLVRDPVNKDSTRLSAVKELNVIVGITIENENGKTKAVRALSDFYSDNKKPPTDTSSSQNTDSTKDAAT